MLNIAIQHVDSYEPFVLQKGKPRQGIFYRKIDSIFYVRPEFAYLKKFLPKYNIMVKSKDDISKSNDESFQESGDDDKSFIVDYYNLFDYGRFVHWIPHFKTNRIEIVNVPSYIKSRILDCFIRCAYSHDIKKIVSKFIDENADFCDVVSSAIRRLDGNVFTRTDKTSGKNYLNVNPVTNVREFFERAFLNKGWLPEYKNDDYVGDYCELKFYLLPWTEIPDDREFRCFVFRRKIVTVCVQKFYNEYDTLPDENAMALKLAEFQREFVDSYEHDNYCVDVWYDDVVYDKILLIEVNPWISSGPGLYTYKDFDDFVETCKNTVVWRKFKKCKKIITDHDDELHR